MILDEKKNETKDENFEISVTFCGGTIKIFANVANSVAGNLFIESVNESDKGECIRNEVRVENRGGWQKGENFCKVKMAIKIRREGGRRHLSSSMSSTG